MKHNSQTEETVANKLYRGWTIVYRENDLKVTYSIYRDGWQSRHNLRTVENAKAKIDAIVG